MTCAATTLHPPAVRQRALRLRERVADLSSRVPRRALRVGLAMAAVAAITTAALRSRSELAPLRDVGVPRLEWLLLAVLAQVASLVAYALIVRRLLELGSVRARLGSLLRATVGGGAMGASIPGGEAASAVYWFKQLRKEGAETGLAAFAIVGSTIASMAALVGLLVVGVAVAGPVGPFAHVRVPLLAAAGAVLLLALVFRRRVARAISLVLRRSSPAARPAGRRGLVAIGAYAVANWVLDCASLWLAASALRIDVPLRGILLTFAIAQLAAAVPILPGGGGTVELTLVLGFATFGHNAGSALAGVLLYRLISCWGLIPIGWAAIALEGRRVVPAEVWRVDHRRAHPRWTTHAASS
jgi:uncharacterized membrane protein YbhN (UPF0104 family)